MVDTKKRIERISHAAAIFNFQTGIDPFGDALQAFAGSNIDDVPEGMNYKYVRDIYLRYQPLALKVYNALGQTVQSGNSSLKERFSLVEDSLTVVEAMATIRDFAATDLRDEHRQASENLRDSAQTIRENVPALFRQLATSLGITLKPSTFEIMR